MPTKDSRCLTSAPRLRPCPRPRVPVAPPRRSMWLGPGLGVLCAVLLGACGEPPERVVVRIAAPALTIPGDLDLVVVSYSASEDGTPLRACEPAHVVLPLSEETTDATEPIPAILPIRLAFEPGSRFDQRLFLRVEGYRQGVLRLRTERMASLRGGDVRMDIELTPSCLDRGIESRQHCLYGLVDRAPYAGIFDTGDDVVRGVSCAPDD